MAADAFKDAIAALFGGIDVDDAQKVLGELSLPIAYSDAAVDAVNAAANERCDVAAKLKKAEAPRSERKAVRAEVDRLVNARAFLYRLRPAQPGDVGVTVVPVGGKG